MRWFQEAELSSWTAFLHRAVDATYNTEIVIDNLHNMIGEWTLRHITHVTYHSFHINPPLADVEYGPIALRE